MFDYLGMKMCNLDETTPVGALIPYYMKNIPDQAEWKVGGEFFRFNDITKWGDIATINSQAASNDPFSLNYHNRIPTG